MRLFYEINMFLQCHKLCYFIFWNFFFNLQVPSINVPRIPAAAFDVFKSFFLAKHSGRILTLLPTTGTVDLNAVFYGTKDHKNKDSSTGSSVTSTPTVEIAGASAVVSVVPGTRSERFYSSHHL